jgi:putative PEP-CTERM system histidine kinase
MTAGIGVTFWHGAATLVYLGGAVAAATVAVLLSARRDRFGSAGWPMVAGLFFTATWCLALAASGSIRFETELAESVRNLGWLYALYRLFANDGRLAAPAPIRPVIAVLGIVEFVRIGATWLLARVALGSHGVVVAFELTLIFRLLFTVGALVLLHNLYAGASRQSQAILRWPTVGLAVLWAFDLNLFTIAYLGRAWPEELAVSRGIAVFALSVLLAIGGSRGGSAVRLRPSRAVTFQTFSLLVIGAYLIGMVAVAQWLAYAGGNFARLVELAFLTIASVAAILLLPSRKLRGWLKVTLAKHFFQHRYDYREEWLRFTRTIGNSGAEAAPLGERLVKAVADIAESPAGLLLAPGDNGELTLAARWQWNSAEVPAGALGHETCSFFEKDGFIVDLDDVRAGRAEHGESDVIPAWLIEETRAWALVPLIHYERLVGVVVLARPPVARRFDWEDFDLLRVVGQQLASYLAEHSGQEALAEAARYDEFHRRIAYVMHDIKNMASQLNLLARNAEIHAEKPAFRADMLVTLRNSSEKLNALLARLSRYGGSVVEQLAEVDAAVVAKRVVDQYRGGHQVILTECHDCTVTANRDSLEQVLCHLVQNAVDASAADSPVFVTLTPDGLNVRFDVIDSGCGMTPEFVRTRLFKPFVSSKPGGFGIGAYEARELVRAMRGRLDVESREGLGSRFTVRLPQAAASELFDTFNRTQRLAS